MIALESAPGLGTVEQRCKMLFRWHCSCGKRGGWRENLNSADWDGRVHSGEHREVVAA